VHPRIYDPGVEVFLIRHAKAEPGEPDELRALDEQGQAQARALGEQLAHDGVRPDAVISSPLLRARQTAEAIARATGAVAEVDERLAPGASASDLRDAVEGRGETVVVVGHQPDCGQIAAAIAGGPEPAFKTAGMLELHL
jgi:phosphohistidine phosphatase